MKISTVGTDQGTEFTANSQYFKKTYNIKWFWLKGKTKAALAENRIKTLKNVLYKVIRSRPKAQWAKIYPEIVEQLNIRPLKALKNRAPADLVSIFEDVRSRPLLTSSTSTETATAPTSKTSSKKKRFSQKFKLGDLVFLETPSSVNERGFDLQRAVISRIRNVDKSAFPYLYSLENLEGEPLSRKYYERELRRAPKLRNIPRQIEHVFDSRRKNKRREYLISFYNSK